MTQQKSRRITGLFLMILSIIILLLVTIYQPNSSNPWVILLRVTPPTIGLIIGYSMTTGHLYNLRGIIGDLTEVIRVSKNPEETNLSGFNNMVSAIETESPDVAHSFRKVKDRFGEGTDDDEQLYNLVADVIDSGIKAEDMNPLRSAIHFIDTVRASKQFVEETEKTDIEVIKRQNYSLIGKLTDGHEGIQRGLRFKILTRTVVSGGEGIVTEPVGTAELTSFDKRACELKVINLKIGYDLEDLQARNLALKFDPMGLNYDEIDEAEIEETYKKLRELDEKRR